MRIIKSFVLFLCCLMSAAAWSQAEPLDGWKRSMSDSIPGRVMYANSAQQMIAYYHPLKESDQASLDKVLVEQVLEMDTPERCPGLSKGQGKLHANGAIKEAATGVCSVFVGKGPKGGFYAVGIDFGGKGTGARDAVIAIIAEEAGVNLGGAAVATTSDAGTKAVSGGVAGDAALQAAMASIPAANRPIDIVLISEWDSVAMSMAFKPRIVFANGYAVDECNGWDLSKIAPTPAALKAIGSDCSVEKWKKVAGNYIFQDDDGDWSEPSTSGNEIKGFRKGQRVDIDKSYVGGGATTSVIPGVSSSSHLNSGELKMNTAGQIGIGSEFSNTIYTSSAVVFHRRRPIINGSGESSTEGRYYLDGYIIAVQAADGSISFGTIGQKQEEKLYIYMNGELYW